MGGGNPTECRGVPCEPLGFSELTADDCGGRLIKGAYETGRVSLLQAPTTVMVTVRPDAPRVLGERPTRFSAQVYSLPQSRHKKGSRHTPTCAALLLPQFARSGRQCHQLEPVSRPRFRRAGPHLGRDKATAERAGLRGRGLGVAGASKDHLPKRRPPPACSAPARPPPPRLVPPPSVSSVLLLGLALSCELCSLGCRVQTET